MILFVSIQYGGFVDMSDLISLPESAVLFGLTYNVFYQRLHKPKYLYPQIIYKNGIPYLEREEVIACAQREKEFLKNHISMKEASKKIFGDARTLSVIRWYRPYCFLPLIVNYGRPYLNRADFEDFYHRCCNDKPLIKLKRIINSVGLANAGLFYFFLRETGFYDEVRSFVFCTNGRKYYNLVDVNKWLKKNRLPRII